MLTYTNHLKPKPTGLTNFFDEEISESERRPSRIEVPAWGSKTTKPGALTPG